MDFQTKTIHICIVGGGNLGHVLAGYFGAKSNVEVSLLTRHPEKWAHQITIHDVNGKEWSGNLTKISAEPADVIPKADIVFQCLPGFAIAKNLEEIKPYLSSTTYVGTVFASTGFLFEALRLLPQQPLFGFQRVPFISRIITYGKQAELKGYKQQLNMAVEQSENKADFTALLAELLDTPITLFDHYLEVSLSNSNPLLHPARLYTLFSSYTEGETYCRIPEFYHEWTDESSQLLIAMDEEFQYLLSKLPVRKGVIQSILDYYESSDAPSLTRKICSIPAFKGIKSPMIGTPCHYIPDFSCRFFTEDFPYGMRYIVETAQQYDVSLPTIEKVYAWGMSKVNPPH